MSSNLIQQLKDFDKGKEKNLLAIKYKAMAENPFRFFRGSCKLFYAGFFNHYPFAGSPAVWCCGDCHIENFGSYKGSNRQVYFDMNDFDEGLLAPALWEISRLAASVQLACEETGFSKKERDTLVDTLLQSYRHMLIKGKAVVVESATARGLIKKLISRVADRKEMELVRKRTTSNDSGRLLISDRLLALPKTEKKPLLLAFNHWLDDMGHSGIRAIDAGFRIAGTGSIGARRYILLLQHTANPQKKLLIDIKEAMPPAAGHWVALAQPVWQHEAARVTAIQEMMEHVSPAFLSCFAYNDTWFVVKELQPISDKVSLAQTAKQIPGIQNYLSDLGMITASAQLRSSGRLGASTADELYQFALADEWINQVTAWSLSYAAQMKQDFTIYRRAWREGAFNV